MAIPLSFWFYQLIKNMAKAKLSDLKRYLAEQNESELREEIFRLFGKLKQVQDYYAQELMPPAERQAMLNQYKKKVDGHFYTRSGMPKNPSNAELRRLMTEFEQISVVKADVVELLIHRVEKAIEFADDFGGMPDGDYNAAANAFEKALKLIIEHKLKDYFSIRCREITVGKGNYDYYFKEMLEELTEQYLG